MSEKSGAIGKTILLWTLKILYLTYPLVVLLTVIILFPRWASAGQIRRLVLSPEKPGVINLAFGNTTAVSFQSKPEKLVPGSPQKVEINFLGKDITISPLMSNPGNLLIYTSGTRYVLLFKVVPEAKHDDVVEIVGAPRAGAKAMKLDQDAYHVETVRVLVKPRNKRQPVKIFSIQGIVFDDRLAGEEISDFLSGERRLRCEKCALSKTGLDRIVICPRPLPNPIKCQSDEFREIELSRGPS